VVADGVGEPEAGGAVVADAPDPLGVAEPRLAGVGELEEW
jgi:hypothetical protein